MKPLKLMTIAELNLELDKYSGLEAPIVKVILQLIATKAMENMPNKGRTGPREGSPQFEAKALEEIKCHRKTKKRDRFGNFIDS